MIRYELCLTTTELILIVLDLDKKMRIEINILDYTTKEMLFMEFVNER